MTLLIAALLGAAVLYLYDLYVNGPPAARLFIAHLPALGWYALVRPDDWRLLESYAAVPLSLLAVGLLQWVTVARDAAMMAAMRRR